MLDHHNQIRFTLLWAPAAEKSCMRDIVVRSVYATFRGRQVPRTEPDGGFQVHEYAADGLAYLKVLWTDAREQKIRLLRYHIFEQFKGAVREGRVPPDTGKFLGGGTSASHSQWIDESRIRSGADTP